MAQQGNPPAGACSGIAIHASWRDGHGGNDDQPPSATADRYSALVMTVGVIVVVRQSGDTQRLALPRRTPRCDRLDRIENTAAMTARWCAIGGVFMPSAIRLTATLHHAARILYRYWQTCWLTYPCGQTVWALARLHWSASFRVSNLEGGCTMPKRHAVRARPGSEWPSVA